MKFSKRIAIAAALVFAAAAETASAEGEAGGTARGVVRASAEAVITSDLGVKLRSLPFREGEAFGKGEVLAMFDCTRLRAEISAAQAAMRADELVFANNRRLLARGAIGGNETKVSQARFEKSRSEALAMAERARECELRAPFAGRVVERLAREFESPKAGEPVLRIVSAEALEVEAIVPSRWLAWLRPGTPFRFSIDETGQSVTARITALGAAVDPVSQTVKVFGILDTGGQSVLPGMSGQALFVPPGS